MRNYTHDVILHVADNYDVHTRHVDSVVTTLPCQRQQDMPDVHGFLLSLCTVPHMVIKTDAQPTGFPAVLRRGNDVDLLTDNKHFETLVNRTRRFFQDASTFREVRDEHNWRFRMEDRGRLVYQIHITEVSDPTVGDIFARRVMHTTNDTKCLWLPNRGDDATLRNLDCATHWRRKRHLCERPQ